MKFDFLGDVEWRAFVFAVTSAKVEGEETMTDGFASKSVIDKRL